MGKFRSPRVVLRERVRSPKFESRRVKLLRDGCACVARVKLGMRNVHRVHVTDIWSWYRVELRVGDHLGRSEELVSRCIECDLAEPESLASLGGSAPGVVDGILSIDIISLFFSLLLIGSPLALSVEQTKDVLTEWSLVLCWGVTPTLHKPHILGLCLAHIMGQ